MIPTSGRNPEVRLSDQFRDIEGNLLAQTRNTPRPMHGHLGDLDSDDLEYAYQVMMVDESHHAPNSLQLALTKREVKVADDD
jgi:hypothetical protein